MLLDGVLLWQIFNMLGVLQGKIEKPHVAAVHHVNFACWSCSSWSCLQGGQYSLGHVPCTRARCTKLHRHPSSLIVVSSSQYVSLSTADWMARDRPFLLQVTLLPSCPQRHVLQLCTKPPSMYIALQGGIVVQGQPLEMPLRPSGKEWWEEWGPKVTLNMFFDIWHQLQAQVRGPARQQSCGPCLCLPHGPSVRPGQGQPATVMFEGQVENRCPAPHVRLFLSRWCNSGQAR